MALCPAIAVDACKKLARKEEEGGVLSTPGPAVAGRAVTSPTTTGHSFPIPSDSSSHSPSSSTYRYNQSLAVYQRPRPLWGLVSGDRGSSASAAHHLASPSPRILPRSLNKRRGPGLLVDHLLDTVLARQSYCSMASGSSTPRPPRGMPIRELSMHASP
jgi:hypothetical protein